MFLTPIYPEIGHENSRFLSTNLTLEKGERNLYCRLILEPGKVDKDGYKVDSQRKRYRIIILNDIWEEYSFRFVFVLFKFSLNKTDI